MKEATIVCDYCGKNAVVQFTKRPPKFCCEKCRRNHYRAKNRRLYHKKMREERQKRLAEQAAAKRRRIIPLHVIQAEIAAYNKAHGTNISYGKYVMMKERGMLEL